MEKLLIALMCIASLGFADEVKKTYSTSVQKVAHAKGLVRTEAGKKYLLDKKALRRSTISAVIPGNWDLTTKVSPPENQGQCGSCWDFSITKALRSALMLAGKDPGRLAFNYLLDNCGPGSSEDGCNGGDFPAGDNMLKAAGPWLESQDPYQGYGTSCKHGLAVAGTAIDWVAVGQGESAPSFQELASALSAGHMLSIDVAVCGDWENYSGGIFNENQCGAGSINHMINMVGYDCETSKDAAGNCVFNSSGEPINGDGNWKVMNNWGTSWGENGYMRSRAHMDALATGAMYFDVLVPTPVPTPTPTPSPTPVPTPAGLSWSFIGMIAAGIIAVAAVIFAIFKK